MGRRHLDAMGMMLSGLCLVHCLALPLLLSMAPGLLDLFVENPRIHLIFAALVIPVGLLAFWPGYRAHRQSWVLGMGAVGLLCIGCGAVAHEALGHSMAHTLSVLGGFQLICAHLANRKLLRPCC